MADALSFFLVAFSAVFVVVDPVAVAPAFASMTSHLSQGEVRSIARRASFTGAALLVFFTLFGGLLFRVLRIELGAFRVAGGLLLLLTAIDMLRGKLSDCRCTKAELEDRATPRDDVAIVPVATPLLAGPGAMATVMMLTSERTGWLPLATVLVTIALTFSATWAILRGASRIATVLRPSGIAILQRVMGLVLAAVAIQFMAEGTRALLG